MWEPDAENLYSSHDVVVATEVELVGREGRRDGFCSSLYLLPPFISWTKSDESIDDKLLKDTVTTKYD